jgi:hypothetical protein
LFNFSIFREAPFYILEKMVHALKFISFKVFIFALVEEFMAAKFWLGRIESKPPLIAKTGILTCVR